MHILKAITFVAVAAAVAGCGGGKTTSTTAAVAQPTTEAQREAAALPQVAVATVPGDLKCGAVKPVWVNIHSKAYHEAGDPYYGLTKNGKYMCPSEAAAQGYHAAGMQTHHKKQAAAATSTPGP